MAEIVVDSSRWPLVQLVYPAEYTDAEYATLIEHLNRLLERREPFVMFQDTRGGAPPTPVQRRMTTEWYADREQPLRTYLKASAMLVESAIVRGVITAIFWVRSPPFPAAAVSTEAEAKAYLRRMYPEADVALR